MATLDFAVMPRRSRLYEFMVDSQFLQKFIHNVHGALFGVCRRSKLRAVVRLYRMRHIAEIHNRTFNKIDRRPAAKLLSRSLW